LRCYLQGIFFGNIGNKMPKFSAESLDKLSTCHRDLQVLFNEVIKHFDCKVTEGFRDKEAQNKAYADGRSQKQWPDGNHNHLPSTAVDVYPYPIDMKDNSRFYFFAGRVLGIAQMLKADNKITHSIRYGGDWNNDTQLKDNHFNDLVHFELIP
jgi:peptidoglycan L-alanyl-D-glutamate endopeptidase CwlK